MMNLKFLPALLLCLVPPSFSHADAPASRTWTDVNGRKLEGTMMQAQADVVKVKLKAGAVVPLPLITLSQADKDYVEQNKDAIPKAGATSAPTPPPKPAAAAMTSGGSKWPDKVIMKDLGEITTVKEDEAASEFIYQSLHYEFHSPKKLGTALVKEFARIFEVTYQANWALPLNFKPEPERGKDRFLCMIYETYEDYIKAGGLDGSAGVYMGGKDFIAVPIKSLGVESFGKKLVIKRGEDNGTLIHEITHQMMNHWLGKLPTWYVEGAAEFIRMAKYERGIMSFNNLDNLFQDFLIGRGSDGKGYQMVNLQKLMTMDGGTWAAALGSGSGAGRNYGSAGALTYYFYTCDDKGDGQHMIDYIEAIGKGENQIKAAALHLLRERTYEKLQEDVEKALRKKGIKITWSQGTDNSKSASDAK
jgi:hypothetical protein